jgi:4-alpha-glucanotransferase
MAAKIKLILGSHAHVPYGSNNAEFENVYMNLMRPFVTSLYKYPGLQAVLHYSGVLLHWVERSHPELFMLINDMIARRQAEILGGGFYEPMLPIIPLQDKIGQIELLTTYIRKQFGKRPQGCWIPGFAWEQGLVSPLASCGMGFTFLGKRQFDLAGGNDAPCICEDQGKLITVFPVSRSIEEDLARKNLFPILKNFNSINNDGAERIVSIFPGRLNTGPDGSVDWAWGSFFEELSNCESFVETVNPGRLVKNLEDAQKLCIPDSTRDENSVPPRRFIIENPETGGIYSKMIFTNVLINQLRGDKSRKLSAHEELWKAQSGDLFCSTSQGPRNHLIRNAAYSALLRAEQVTRDKGKFAPSLVPFDFNLDGVEEWLFQDAKINCYVQSVGGGIFELDYQPTAWNYLDTCAGRLAFADSLLPKGTAVETPDYDSIKGAAARLCYNERYELVELDKVRRRLRLLLRQAPAAAFGSVEIEKSFQVKRDSIHVSYTITNRGAESDAFLFAPMIDLALPGEGESFARFYACKPGVPDAPVSVSLRETDCLKIHDIKNEVQITLSSGKLFDGRITPVYSGDPEKGGKFYQAYCVMPVFPLTLEAGNSWEAEFTLKFSH